MYIYKLSDTCTDRIGSDRVWIGRYFFFFFFSLY